MNIRLGLYEFLSYNIPGVCHLLVIFYFAQTVGYHLNFDYLLNLSVPSVIALIVIAYILGNIFAHLAKLWYRLVLRRKNYSIMTSSNPKPGRFRRWLFKNPSARERAYASFVKTNPTKSTIIKIDHTMLYIAQLRKENQAIADDIERLNALSIMMRNISFSIFLFSLTILVNIFFTDYSTTKLALFFFSLILIYSSIQHANRYNIWFFSMIYEAIAVRTTHTLEDAVNTTS